MIKTSTVLNLALAGCVIALLVGCASTKVTNREQLVYDKLPRPDHILVENFTAGSADLLTSAMFPASASSAPTTPPGDEQVALARQFGVQISAELVAAIHGMGMSAAPGTGAATPQLNDIVIRGYLVAMEKGSVAERMIIGFGAGGSKLTAIVELHQMTANGLRKLGSATTSAKGSKGPGATLGGAAWLITGNPIGLVLSGGLNIYGEASGSARLAGRAKATAREIADVLKQRFQEEGWINQSMGDRGEPQRVEIIRHQILTQSHFTSSTPGG